MEIEINAIYLESCKGVVGGNEGGREAGGVKRETGFV